MKKLLPRTKQCAKCPWKVSTKPSTIPNGYCPTKHAALKNTIAEPGSLHSTGHSMACHHSTGNDQMYCVGWLWHQLGPGNNIPLRIKMLDYDLKGLKVYGRQHPDFRSTLPKNFSPNERQRADGAS